MAPSDLFPIPDFCPICSGKTVVVGDFLYCRSDTCPSRLAGAVKVWIRNLGLLYWGDTMIDALTDPEKARIGSVADLYRMSVEDLAECCSGVKMAKKCHSILHSNKSVSLELVLASLNIPNFGLSTASDVVRAGYDTVDKVLRVGYDELKAVPNIGEKTARNIQAGLMACQDVLLDLESVLDIRLPGDGPLQGKTVCITGELSRPRKAVEKMIMDAGGSPRGSVSKDTSFLITNNLSTTSSKMGKAKKYEIPVIDEAELMRLIGSGNL